MATSITYDDLRNNNPYQNMTYTQSSWDKFIENLGFRSGRMKFEDEKTNNALMYGAQLDQAQREEEYNSATEQVNRQREAGLNPDLNGQVTAGEATPVDNQATQAPETPGTESIQDVMSATFTPVFGFITNLANVASAVTGAISGIQDTQFKRDEHYTSLFNTIYSGIQQLLSEHPEVLNEDDYEKTIKDWFGQTENAVYLDSKRGQRMFDSALEAAIDSYRTLGMGYAQEAETITNRNTVGELRADPFYNENLWNVDDATEYQKPIRKAMWNIIKAKQKYEKEYWDRLKGTDKADAENQANLTKWLQDKMQYEVAKEYDELIQYYIKSNDVNSLEILSVLLNWSTGNRPSNWENLSMESLGVASANREFIDDRIRRAKNRLNEDYEFGGMKGRIRETRERARRAVRRYRRSSTTGGGGHTGGNPNDEYIWSENAQMWIRKRNKGGGGLR